MAIAHTKTSFDTDFANAIVYRNKTVQQSLQWEQNGVATPSVTGLNSKYDITVPPAALGSGVYVDTAGRWLHNPVLDPVAQYVIINAGSADIYVGINAPASGQWGIGSGITIPSGSSYEFGEPGTQIIRNLWAMSSTGSQLVQGYSTRLSNWI